MNQTSRRTAITFLLYQTTSSTLPAILPTFGDSFKFCQEKCDFNYVTRYSLSESLSLLSSLSSSLLCTSSSSYSSLSCLVASSMIASWSRVDTLKKDTVHLGDCKEYNELDVIPRKCKPTDFFCEIPQTKMQKPPPGQMKNMFFSEEN